MIQCNDSVGCIAESFCYMQRHFTFVLVLQRMFNRCPEIHCHSTNLDFCLKSLRTADRIYSIINNQMITSVSALFDVFEVIFFTFYHHIAAVSDHRGNSINIFFELTYDTDSGDVFYFFFHFIHRDMLALHFFQNAWKTFYTTADLLYRRIQVVLLMFIYNMFKFYHQFSDGKLIWT